MNEAQKNFSTTTVPILIDKNEWDGYHIKALLMDSLMNMAADDRFMKDKISDESKVRLMRVRKNLEKREGLDT